MGRALRLLPVLIAFLVVAGSGGKGDVTGTVKYKGETMTKGSVTFQGGDGKTYTGDIGADGKYTVRGVPSGTAKVAVNVIDDSVTKHFRDLSAGIREQQKAAGSDPEKTTFVPPKVVDPSSFYIVPQRYASVDTSGITFEVKSGKNVYDIDIND